MLQSLYVCYLFCCVVSRALRVLYIIDPDAPRNQSANELLKAAMQIVAASADTLYVGSPLDLPTLSGSLNGRQ
jgi:hypothetical protein